MSLSIPLSRWQHRPGRTFHPEVWLFFSRSKGAAGASIGKGLDVKDVESRPESLKKAAVLVIGIRWNDSRLT